MLLIKFFTKILKKILNTFKFFKKYIIKYILNFSYIYTIFICIYSYVARSILIAATKAKRSNSYGWLNSCQFLYKNFFLFSRGRTNCECSCIIINCNRMQLEHSQFAISMQIRWLAVTAKCHCRSIKTDDLPRCLMRWPCALSQWCDSMFYFWFFRFILFVFIFYFFRWPDTIFIKIHEIASNCGQCTYI